MMEFIIVFSVSLCILLLLAVALYFGKSPTYRPKRADILVLLHDVISGKASHDSWLLFLSLPINHDPELDEIRQLCLSVDEGADDQPAANEGLSGAIYDAEGLKRIAEIEKLLKVLIAKEPASKWF